MRFSVPRPTDEILNELRSEHPFQDTRPIAENIEEGMNLQAVYNVFCQLQGFSPICSQHKRVIFFNDALQSLRIWTPMGRDQLVRVYYRDAKERRRTIGKYQFCLNAEDRVRLVMDVWEFWNNHHKTGVPHAGKDSKMLKNPRLTRITKNQPGSKSKIPTGIKKETSTTISGTKHPLAHMSLADIEDQTPHEDGLVTSG